MTGRDVPVSPFFLLSSLFLVLGGLDTAWMVGGRRKGEMSDKGVAVLLSVSGRKEWGEVVMNFCWDTVSRHRMSSASCEHFLVSLLCSRCCWDGGVFSSANT